MDKNIDFKEMIDSLRSGLAEPIFSAFGIQVLYTEENLDTIEKVIDVKFPNEREVMPTTVIPFGYILGETLVRNIPGAKWKTDVTELWDIAVEVDIENKGDKISVLPFLRADKFFKDRTDSLAVMYRMVNMMSLQFLDPLIKKAKYDEWINLQNGDSFRLCDPKNYKNEK